MEPLIRQHSGYAHLLRSTSRTFTGGAAPSTPAQRAQDGEPTETTPIRQQSSTRVETQDMVQQRLSEEMQGLVMGSLKWILLVAALFCTLLITMLILFVLALVAVINHNDKPCDQPLKYYLLAGILWSQVPGFLVELIGHNWNTLNKLVLNLFFSLPGWGIIGWGVWMVHSSETCHTTNPDLFYPTKHYIYGQIVMASFLLIATIFGAFGFRRALLILNTLIVKPGCEEAVHKLQRVEEGSAELISAEDGQVLSCPICIESLSSAVKTPCSHLFHEECLAHWCKNHTDCPLCRQQVGAPDPKDGEP